MNFFTSYPMFLYISNILTFSFPVLLFDDMACYFLIVLYSIPQGIIDLITLLKNFVLNLVGILLSHNTPNTFPHFIHHALILWFTFPSICPSLWITNSTYQNTHSLVSLDHPILQLFHLYFSFYQTYISDIVSTSR